MRPDEILKLASSFESLSGRQGTIYLIHFHKQIGSEHPRGKALHYMGWSENLFNRLDQHAVGQGSAIMRYLNQVGIGWRLVRTWIGTRDDERRLKNRKNARQLCPICTPGA
jgi:hypothetical protein